MSEIRDIDYPRLHEQDSGQNGMNVRMVVPSRNGLDSMASAPRANWTRRGVIALLVAWCCAGGLAASAQEAARGPKDAAGVRFFESRVAPLLASRCLECHNADHSEGELDLSREMSVLRGGDSGAAIDRESPFESLLWHRVDSGEMPPEDPLSDEEKRILRTWLEQGAAWGAQPIDPFDYSSDERAGYDWWSLQALARPEVPADPSGWSLNEVDRFILAGLVEQQLRPSSRAEPRTLVRRLYFDLLGLPAPPEVIERFAAHPSQDRWEALVDELLASPHYGERWARHWMDIARFGESQGYEYNEPRSDAWHYRDWLIRSLNEDLPYDQFARMQIAGDLLEPNSVDGAAAVGFLVAGIHNTVLGQSPEMKLAGRHEELEEIAGVVGQAFLGMTVHCARCHDHKFDPISTREYYQFIAALDGVHHGVRQVMPSSAGTERREADQLRTRLLERIGDRLPDRLSANRIRLRAPVAANKRDVTYTVSFRLSPTVWAGRSQATGHGDGIVVRLIRPDGEILARAETQSEPWNGRQDFQEHSFTYIGDGTGDLLIDLGPYPLHSGRFGGAVDDLAVADAQGRRIFFESFDRLKRLHPAGQQADSAVPVFYGATSPVWDHQGVNSIHLVQHAEDDFALQLFAGNGETQSLLSEASTDAERRLLDRLRTLEGETPRVEAAQPTPVFTVVGRDPAPMRLLRRGDVRNAGDEVAPGGLKAVQQVDPSFKLPATAGDAARRTQLAQWISHRENGPFHRVIVNRVWHFHFGRGIVETPGDFGFNGGRPSHPELLEWLATWLRDNDYSLKKLHRLILTSATYQQSSRSDQSETAAMARQLDRSNRLLWRQNPRRMDAETLRDSVLQIADALNRRQFGPGFVDVRIDKVGVAHYYVAVDPVGPEFNRRTIYRWQVRGERNSLLESFDCPDPSTPTPKRNVTTTASQALSQWNHPFMLRMADRLAERIRAEAGPEIDEQVNTAWRLVLGRTPDEEEAAEARQLVSRHELQLLARVLLNSNELIWIE